MNSWPQPIPSDTHSISAAITMPSAGLAAGPERKKKILIVDDSLVVRKLLAMKLKASGYETMEAEDGPAAVGAVRERRPDLMLLDISFPADVAHGGAAWDGFQIMQWMQRMDEAKAMPIMIITSGTPEEYRSRSFAAGACGFFQKPIKNEELLVAIEQVLGEERLGDVGPRGQAPVS